jgi:CubicO group peptidase (beta-lactamase class C family)
MCEPMSRAVQLTAIAACCLSAAANALPKSTADLDYRPVPGVWPQPQPARSLQDLEELEAFIDTAIEGQLETSYVPGVAVAVVKRDRTGGRPIVLSRGYGHADRERQMPVDPQRTLFRIGSISKLLTWTAVMQLAEQNRLDLSADINTYLENKLRIPATYAEPVTLRHLMTHTAGFEANSYGYSAARGCCSLTLAQTLLRHMPARVQPPVTDFTRGEGVLYTNSAAALAGHIVERRSGQPFARYVEQHIFAPLDMTVSTFEEPVPLGMRRHLSLGYVVSVSADGEADYRTPGFEYFHPVAPAASATATAADMARFMLAHLQEGRYGERRILQEDTVQLMHSRVLSPHPQVNGAAYGFLEKYINGHRTLWHQGITTQFYAELYLLPEEDVGLFVAYNSPPPAAGELMRAFMDHYFPARLPELKPYGDAAARAVRYAGTYGPVVHSHTTWEKRNLLDATHEVLAVSRGLRIVDYPMPGDASEWIELAEVAGVFRRHDGDETIAFAEGADGRTYLFGDDAYAPLRKLGSFETPRFDQLLVSLCVAGFLATILFAIRTVLDPRIARSSRLAAGLAALVALVDLAILSGVEVTSDWDTYELLVALPWPLTMAMALSLVSLPLTLALALVVAQGWRRADWSARARLWHTASLLPLGAFVGWLYFWNLIGFQVA